MNQIEQKKKEMIMEDCQKCGFYICKCETKLFSHSMKQQTKNLNKQLQEKIGSLIGKDYFKLEFGQPVIHRGELFTYIESGMAGKYTIYNTRCNAIFVNPLEVEPIGTEPTLQDLLLAMFKNGKSYNISQFGEIFEIKNGERNYLFILNLKKSLFQQSDEVKLAIIQLLS